MADTKISGLTALTGANTASGDLLTIVDISDSTMAGTGTNKKITLTELQGAPVSAGTANGVLYLNGSKVATSGSALTFDGTKLTVGTATAAGALTVVAPASTSYGAFDAPTAGFSFHDYKYNGTRYGLIGQGSALYVSGSNTDFGVLASNALVFGASGTEGMRLTSTGLGIGTSSPTQKLAVYSAAADVTGISLQNASTGGHHYVLASAGQNQFYDALAGSFALRDITAGATRFIVDSSGNLGLGVTPSAWTTFTSVLQIKQSSLFSYNGNTYLYSNYYYDGSPRYMTNNEAMGYAQENGAHTWYTAPSGTAGNAITFTQAMTLDASGNLGIGTSSVGTKLEVSGAASTNQAARFVIRAADTSSVASGNGGGILFRGVYTGTTLVDAAGINAYKANATDGNYAYGLQFNTRANGSDLTSNMVLDPSGNLGIGTGSPGAKLDVVSTASVVGRFATNQTNTDVYLTASGTTDGYTRLRATGGDMVFITGLNERMRLDSSGNLGLGVAPSAWQGTSKALQIGVYSAFFQDASGYPGISFNAVQDPTLGWKRNFADVSTRYSQTNGQHQWYTAPSGTAGNAISFTQAMTLDASGNLLVGTTSSSLSNSNSIIGVPSFGGFQQQHASGTGSGTSYTNFIYNAGVIGSITQSGTTAVLFNVTSDQRLKENIVDAPEFGSVIDSIKVRSYDWKVDGNHQRAGFVAQELVTVAPEAVHQPVDPEEMMAVDYSKLVPMLVKEIQSLRKRLADAGIA